LRVTWPQAWRVIASKYPPIDLFERVSGDPAVWDALIALEELTNPRIRDQLGNIALVAPEDRVSGPGATYVMASFTHVNPNGSRFSDGSYGVYYAASTMGTAIAETIHHFEEFCRDSNDPQRAEDMRVLVGTVDRKFDTVSCLPKSRRQSILHPDDYSAARIYAAALRATGATGVHYPSVRHMNGECIAAFKPSAIGLPVQERHLQYHWDGTRVDKYFDYAEHAWKRWP
jgi:hypothetical protein